MQNSSTLGHSKYRENGLEKIINLVNHKVTLQAIWPISKSVIKRGGQKVPSAIHGPLGPIFYPVDKANIVADCLENQFRAHDFVTVATDNMWRLKLKPYWLQSMKTHLLISDPVTSQKKCNP
jgi:hypothetical protein